MLSARCHTMRHKVSRLKSGSEDLKGFPVLRSRFDRPEGDYLHLAQSKPACCTEGQYDSKAEAIRFLGREVLNRAGPNLFTGLTENDIWKN